MATWFEITFTGDPTEADFKRVAELAADGFTSGQLINEPGAERPSELQRPREQITETASAYGWLTDKGYHTDAPLSAGWSGHYASLGVHVEFSSKGGITYAATSVDGKRWDIMTGPGRLDRVLKFLRREA